MISSTLATRSGERPSVTKVFCSLLVWGQTMVHTERQKWRVVFGLGAEGDQ